MFGLGAGEVLLILVFALIFIGPKKLPELAKSLGKGIREFQKAKDDLMTQVNNEASSLMDDPTHNEEHHPKLTGVEASEQSDDEVEKEVAAMKEALEKSDTPQDSKEDKKTT